MSTVLSRPVYYPEPEAYAPAQKRMRVAPVVAALSRALDLSTGQPSGHSIRTCILGMRLGREIGLPAATQSDLFYALLLKDAGCSSNASKLFHYFGSDDLRAKRDVKTTDLTRVSWQALNYVLTHAAPGKPFKQRVITLLRMAWQKKRQARDVTEMRCERGASMARLMGLSERTAAGIASLDELWNGQGHPNGLRKTEIPVLSRIMLLAQTLEAFRAGQSTEEAIRVVIERSGRWFDPDLVKAAQAVAKRRELWSGIGNRHALPLLLSFEPEPKTTENSATTLDSICMAFAQIVDAKSPFTYNHSNGVANAAVAIGRALGLSPSRVLFLRHTALLHDLGKLGVSNAILEKPDKPDASEWEILKQHPFHTWNILRDIPGFEEMSEIAASHHEKLDGSGYFRGLSGAQLPLEARILVVADIFDALAAARPYRDAMPLDKVFEILQKDTPRALDAHCVDALRQSGAASDQTYIGLQTLNNRLTSFSKAPSLAAA